MAVNDRLVILLVLPIAAVYAVGRTVCYAVFVFFAVLVGKEE